MEIITIPVEGRWQEALKTRDSLKGIMIITIIQARLGSKRLPNKVLADIIGKPMLIRVIERVEKSKLINDIVVATTTREEDKQIILACIKKGVSWFAGSEQDVLDRFYKVALKYHPNFIVRITADCPLIDPMVIDKTVGLFLEKGFDYASNIGTYPDGLDTEILTFEALERTWKEASSAYDREHVTTYIRNNPEKFKIGQLMPPEPITQDYHWSVDEQEDL